MAGGIGFEAGGESTFGPEETLVEDFFGLVGGNFEAKGLGEWAFLEEKEDFGLGWGEVGVVFARLAGESLGGAVDVVWGDDFSAVGAVV